MFAAAPGVNHDVVHVVDAIKTIRRVWVTRVAIADRMHQMVVEYQLIWYRDLVVAHRSSRATIIERSPRLDKCGGQELNRVSATAQVMAAKNETELFPISISNVEVLIFKLDAE